MGIMHTGLGYLFLFCELSFSGFSDTWKGDKAGIRRGAALASFMHNAKCMTPGHLGAETDKGSLLCAAGGPLPESQEALPLTQWSWSSCWTSPELSFLIQERKNKSQWSYLQSYYSVILSKEGKSRWSDSLGARQGSWHLVQEWIPR